MSNRMREALINILSYIPACLIAPKLWEKFIPIAEPINPLQLGFWIWVLGMALFTGFSVFINQKIVASFRKSSSL
jgi:hypothetical protein